MHAAFFFNSLLTNVVLLVFLLRLGKMESQQECFWKRKMHIKSMWIWKAMYFSLACILSWLVVKVLSEFSVFLVTEDVLMNGAAYCMFCVILLFSKQKWKQNAISEWLVSVQIEKIKKWGLHKMEDLCFSAWCISWRVEWVRSRNKEWKSISLCPGVGGWAPLLPWYQG